jgi:hypothetical protein
MPTVSTEGCCADVPYELVEAAANIQPSNCKINFEIQDRPSERFGVVVGDECV